jgi:hypothetical protein
MGCGCKDPEEGLNIQDKPSELPIEAIDEFQSKIASLQSEKNIWKASYEDLNAQVTAITTKLDALLDTLPENVQQQFNEAFSEAPVAPAEQAKEDKIFTFTVKVYAEVPAGATTCDVLDDMSIQPIGDFMNLLQMQVGDATLEDTNLDDVRAKINKSSMDLF